MHPVTRELIPHPDTPSAEVSTVHVHLALLPDGKAMLRCRVEGIGQLVVPEFKGRGRADELWKTTCFEIFLGNGVGDAAVGAYREFNFSPSGRWAAYEFTSYRGGMRTHDPVDWPEISGHRGSGIYVFTAFFPASELVGFTNAGLCAVIEEAGGRRSYWALAHGEGKPDFHDPACFAAKLGAPNAS